MTKENSLKPGFFEAGFWRWFWELGLAFILTGIFTELAEDVWFKEGFAWDAPIILAIHQLSTPWLDNLMRMVTQLGESGAIVLVIALVAWFVWKHRNLDALTILLSFGGAVAFNTLLKLLLTRPRPALFPPLVVESGFSFPSGHVTASVAVYGFLAVLLWRNKHYFWALAAGSLVPVVAFSRIYLGVHYPSDTLGAMAFTTLWLMLVLTLRDHYLKRQAPPGEDSLTSSVD